MTETNDSTLTADQIADEIAALREKCERLEHAIRGIRVAAKFYVGTTHGMASYIAMLCDKALNATDDAERMRKVLRVSSRNFQIGDKVEKISGSSWRGTIVGFYSTDLTPNGYCIESMYETGSVQNYPEAALCDRGE